MASPALSRQHRRAASGSTTQAIPNAAAIHVPGLPRHLKPTCPCCTVSAPMKVGKELRMKESYGKDLASHPDPESCVCIGNDAGEALTGAHAGQVMSCEINLSGAPTLLTEAEGHTTQVALARLVWAPRSRRP